MSLNMLDMLLNSTCGSVSQKIIKGAVRPGILFLRPTSILKSNVYFLSKAIPSAGKSKSKQNDKKSQITKASNMRTRKTYVMHHSKEEATEKTSNPNAENANDVVPQNRVTLNAGSVYQFMQGRENPVPRRNLTQSKHWVLETQSPAYRLDLMYKKHERGRDTKVLEDIKLIYLKRMENIQNLMNKPEKKATLTQKMCDASGSLISKVKNFHSLASTYKKREDEPPALQPVSDSTKSTKTAPEEPSAPPAEPPSVKSPSAAPSEPPTASPIQEPPVVTPTSSIPPEAPPVRGASKPPTVAYPSAAPAEAPIASPDINLEFPKVLRIQPKHREELEVSSCTTLHPNVPIAQHCSHRVTHVIQHVDSETKAKAYVKKTEEIFDLQDVEGIIPVHIDSVEKPLVLGDSAMVKKVKIKEFDRRGKLHPESLEYMWIEILLPKILKHIQYLDENREDAQIVSNNVSVNSLDFIKKDPRTKFSGFPQESGKKKIDAQSQD